MRIYKLITSTARDLCGKHAAFNAICITGYRAAHELRALESIMPVNLIP